MVNATVTANFGLNIIDLTITGKNSEPVHRGNYFLEFTDQKDGTFNLGPTFDLQYNLQPPARRSCL